MVIGWVGSGKTPTGPKPSPAESHCCPFDEAVKKLTVEQGFSAMYATLATTPATAFYQTYFTFGGNRNDPDAKGIIVDNCNCWIDSVVFDFPILYRILYRTMFSSTTRLFSRGGEAEVANYSDMPIYAALADILLKFQ
ncbi:hypothetical protein KEM48_001604 [Puccinia striiformis f. sp. tritici PST-130]|nr:hypothetical protein KEM48_001604 [Puccinia striiformis f. sp. tritici PST-130]